jgi:hypothetical protein
MMSMVDAWTIAAWSIVATVVAVIVLKGEQP